MVEKDWDPGGDGRDVKPSNLPPSTLMCFPPSEAIKEDCADDMPSSVISTCIEKLLFSTGTLFDTCWDVATIPLADVRLEIKEDLD